MSDLTKTTEPIQVEATRFRSAVSEALLQLIGGNINYLLGAVLPVGSYIFSDLTEAQFQGEVGSGWELADGGDCTGSAYAILTGRTTKPDARGLFLRGKNNGRSTSTGNAAGDSALGAYQADAFKTHVHSFQASFLPEIGGPIVHDDGSEFHIQDVNGTNATGDTTNGGETKPRNLTTNIFFRID